MSDAPEAPHEGGRFAENIMHFGRALRTAGLPVGPGRMLEAIRAVETAGIRRRDDFYWTLHAIFVNRRDQKELFDQAFQIFWRNPELLEKMMSLLLPVIHPDIEQAPTDKEQAKTMRRVAEALVRAQQNEPQASEQKEIEIDATLTFSDEEKLQSKDFEEMTATEVDEARRAIQRMRLPLAEVKTRRFAPKAHGRRVDMRRSFRSTLKSGGDIVTLEKRARVRRHPPLVILCDISGSMERYSRMMLHFMHAVTNDRDRVHSFVFGTRLSNISRHLKQRDVDIALEKVGKQVEDWSGGTRIGATLAEFNLNWSRRVLGQGAVVLMITDGLDRDAGDGLEKEIDRLHRSCRRLIWLNPLLRYEDFKPKARGIRAILPHVDEFLPVHNLQSLDALTTALSDLGGPRSIRPISRYDMAEQSA
ncbi:MAG: vWA domain-containing protein [Minwuia sp.]|uniref:vWA domain-containing protein n=1 Tax=Minwuia sp. TaxID=2493630 RepID=UPI003A893334